MKSVVLTAAAVAAAGTLLAGTTALAAPLGGDPHAPGDRATRPAAAAPAKSAAETATDAAPVVPAAAYNNACGAGYNVVDHLPITTLGTVYLTYNLSNGKNCVVTIRNTTGAKLPMLAWIQRSGEGASYVEDRGDYTSYAGPRYLSAARKCVSWGGMINHHYASQYDSHCG